MFDLLMRVTRGTRGCRTKLIIIIIIVLPFFCEEETKKYNEMFIRLDTVLREKRNVSVGSTA